MQKATTKVEPNYSEISIAPAFRAGVLLELKLILHGYAKFWENDGLEYYVFKCKKHGKVDYPHGHDEFLICHQCELERSK